MPYKEEQIKLLIFRYQQSAFAFVLYLIGGDQDKAYDICAASFAEAMRAGFPLEHEEVFLNRLVSIAVEKIRNVKTIPNFDVIELLEISGAEKGQLLIVLKALQTLDFEQKAPLLLRYQINLSYRDIGAVMRISEGNARIKTAQARAQLEKESERILNNS